MGESECKHENTTHSISIYGENWYCNDCQSYVNILSIIFPTTKLEDGANPTYPLDFFPEIKDKSNDE